MEENHCVKIPSEILEKIFILLRPSDIFKCRLVSREFKCILDNPFFYIRKVELGVSGLYSRMRFDLHVIDKEIKFYKNHDEEHFFERIIKPIRSEYTMQFRAFGLLGVKRIQKKKEKTHIHPFEELFEAWSLIIRNEDKMNYSLVRSPVLYLMKFDATICVYKARSTNTLKEGIKNLKALLKKRKNWDDATFLNDKLRIYKEIGNAVDTCFAKSVEYQPTLICQHCLLLQNLMPEKTHLKVFGRPQPNQQHDCSTCVSIYSRFDNWVDSDSNRLCVLNHILQLCFNHRIEILDDFSQKPKALKS